MVFGKHSKSIKWSIFFLDIAITVISFFLALFIRYALRDVMFFEFNMEMYVIVFIITMLIWIIMLRMHNPVPTLPDYTFKDAVFDLTKRVLFGIIIIFSISFIIRGMIISRFFIFLFGFINIILLIAERRVFFVYKRRQYRRGIGLTRIIIIADSHDAPEIIDVLKSHIDWGVKVVDIISPKRITDKAFADEMKTMHIDIAVFILDKNTINKFNKIINSLMDLGVKTMLYLDSFIDSAHAFVEYQSFFNFDFIVFSAVKQKEFTLYMKYTLDKIAAIALIVLLSPLMLITASLILLFEGRPILFKQKRVGFNGELFNIIKFRTMQKDAEIKKQSLKRMNMMSGPVFKIKNDPRVTRIGAFLRRWAIDELPQLINIIRGDMSFVGPRPPLPEEVKEYQLWQRRRLSMKPGLTCTWQISGKNNIDFQTWMYMDMEYIDHWTLLYDFIIVMRTLPAIIREREHV